MRVRNKQVQGNPNQDVNQDNRDEQPPRISPQASRAEAGQARKKVKLEGVMGNRGITIAPQD